TQDNGRGNCRLRLGGWDYVARPSRTAASLAHARIRRPSDSQTARFGARGATVWIREVRPVERRSELLPLADAHWNRGLDESRPSGGSVPVRADAEGGCAETGK